MRKLIVLAMAIVSVSVLAGCVTEPRKDWNAILTEDTEQAREFERVFGVRNQLQGIKDR
jgi:outer membrane murein-binding lipoprotein Lpp